MAQAALPVTHDTHSDHPAPSAGVTNTKLGMWVFLITEILFFGGALTAYMVYRTWYPDAFAYASSEIAILPGAINTAVLILSSLTMALAVHGAQTGERGKVMFFIVITMILGATFLGIKAYEYHEKYLEHHIPGFGLPFVFEEPYARPAQIFFSIYFVLTGLQVNFKPDQQHAERILPITQAVASFEQPPHANDSYHFFVTTALDQNPQGGWAIYPRTGQSQFAVFALPELVTSGADSSLTVSEVEFAADAVGETIGPKVNSSKNISV